MNDSIVALGGVVVGALRSAGLTFWQSKRQRKWQLADLESTRTAERDQEVRARADAKAEEVLVELETTAALASTTVRAPQVRLAD